MADTLDVDVMKPNRKGAGGPKPRKWRTAASISFTNWLSFGSTSHVAPPVADATADPKTAATTIRWSFTFGAEDPAQMVGHVGSRVGNVVQNVSGRLLCKGSGSNHGEGTCHHYWIVRREEAGGTQEEEVEEGTPGALMRTRGFSSDLLIELDDGTKIWCNSHHVKLLETDQEA